MSNKKMFSPNIAECPYAEPTLQRTAIENLSSVPWGRDYWDKPAVKDYRKRVVSQILQDLYTMDRRDFDTLETLAESWENSPEELIRAVLDLRHARDTQKS